MKKVFLNVFIWFLTIALSVGSVVASNTLLETEKGNIEFYGFVKIDSMYQDGGVNIRTAAMYATPGDNADFHINANTSRFGFKWSGTEFDNGWTLGAKIELDLFDTSSRNKMKIRDRIMAFTLSKGNSTWLIGQHWDLFSPVNGTTLMTIGNFYMSGNMGFRRSQMRYTYSEKSYNFAISVNDPTTEDGIESGSPLLESRLGFTSEGNIKANFGISAASGKETKTAANYETDVDVLGVSLDWVIQFNKNFTFKGEYAMGENLATFMSRSGTYNNIENMKFEGKEVTNYWVEFLYSGNKFNAWVAYGQESLTEQTQLATGDLEDTSFIVVALQYKFSKSVSFGLELSNLKSEYYMLNNNDTTKQAVFSAIYKF